MTEEALGKTSSYFFNTQLQLFTVSVRSVSMNPCSKNCWIAGDNCSNRIDMSLTLQTKFSIVFSLHKIAISISTSLNLALCWKWILFCRIDLNPFSPSAWSYSLKRHFLNFPMHPANLASKSSSSAGGLFLNRSVVGSLKTYSSLLKYELSISTPYKFSSGSNSCSVNWEWSCS